MHPPIQCQDKEELCCVNNMRQWIKKNSAVWTKWGDGYRRTLLCEQNEAMDKEELCCVNKNEAVAKGELLCEQNEVMDKEELCCVNKMRPLLKKNSAVRTKWGNGKRTLLCEQHEAMDKEELCCVNKMRQWLKKNSAVWTNWGNGCYLVTGTSFLYNHLWWLYFWFTPFLTCLLKIVASRCFCLHQQIIFVPFIGNFSSRLMPPVISAHTLPFKIDSSACTGYLSACTGYLSACTGYLSACTGYCLLFSLAFDPPPPPQFPPPPQRGCSALSFSFWFIIFVWEMSFLFLLLFVLCFLMSLPCSSA